MNDSSAIAKNMATLLFDDVAVEQVGDGALSYYYAPATNQGDSSNASKPRMPDGHGIPRAAASH